MKYTEPIQNQPPLPTGPDANGGKNVEPHAQTARRAKGIRRSKKIKRTARGMY